jgi:hypothetical protein
MKQFLILLSFFLFVFTSCEDNEEEEILIQETGIVVDYAGTGSCSFVIELDNGSRVQPLYYPDNFTFTNGQKVLVEYYELENIVSSCDQGTACQIEYIEELSCASYIDLYYENYDSLTCDPVYLHDAYMDGDCLYFKVSYSGGCQEHTIDLARMHSPTTSNSDVPTFEIRHNANGDLCESYFTKEFRYDLSELKTEGKNEFVLTAKLFNDEVYSNTFNLD